MSQIFKPKFFSLLKSGISRSQVQADVLSGVVVGIVALPLAIAFAVASGVSPEKGLITAVIAGFIISLLGGSRVQIGGPTGAFIVIVYGIVEQYGLSGLMISTVMAGLILILLGVLRLGSLLRYFPRPLVVGFTSGIALVIFSTQIRDAFGLDIDKVPSDFVEKWMVFGQQMGSVNYYALGVTALTILIVVFTKRFTARIPGSFIAIIAGTAVVQLFQFPVSTIASFFGEIPVGFGFELPDVQFMELGRYIQPALTIAILGGVESLLSAVVSDGMISGNHRSNTELIAQGIANVVTPFFGGIPATGAIARTATNVKNGGRTPIAGMVHALTLLLIMVFFGRWAKLIPMSVLAGVLIVVAYNMSEWRSFLSIMKSSKFDILVLLSTFFLTVLVDLTVAIEVGVVLAALLFMKRMSDISDDSLVREVDKDVIDDYNALPEGLSVFEISGPLFFGSAKEYSEIIKSVGGFGKVLIIRMRHVPFIDSTGMHNLKGALITLHHAGIEIVLSGVRPKVMEELEKGGITRLVGEENVFNKFDLALVKAIQLAEAKSK
ncbi:MAG: STAS domain-containing protein [Bacteroidales bacterium]|nr:STAS domain-containing protein [Bacteroidales bacterium]